MTQFQSEKSTIAWFKLAEFVMRKEKERALGMYRLLVHSLPDEAYSAQLEGDLLRAFNDERAQECFVKAARIYEKDGRYCAAISLYEQLIILNPDTIENYLKALKLYEQLALEIKIKEFILRLLPVFIKQNIFQQAATLINEAALPAFDKATLYENFLFLLIETKYNDMLFLKALAQSCIDNFLVVNNSYHIKNFISKLSNQPGLHQYSLEYFTTKAH